MSMNRSAGHAPGRRRLILVEPGTQPEQDLMVRRLGERCEALLAWLEPKPAKRRRAA